MTTVLSQPAASASDGSGALRAISKIKERRCIRPS
jgi:hypothetical protein